MVDSAAGSVLEEDVEITDGAALTSQNDVEEVLNDNEGPATYIVNETSFSDYFDENGFLREIVKPGDTLDFQGRITVEDV